MSEPARGIGYRGYIGSRPIAGSRVPQHIQNLVLREYARGKGLAYKLSATEYAMDHCYMMLEQVVNELPAHEGIILYSMFMMPQRAERRHAIYDRVLNAGCALYAAAEDFVLSTRADVQRWEDIFLIEGIANRVRLDVAAS